MASIDQLIAKLTKERDDIQTRIRSITFTIRTLEAARSSLEGLELPDSFILTPPPDIAAAALSAPVLPTPSPAMIAERVYELLRVTGRPMVRGEIVRELEARGIVVPGTDQNKNLGTILWRNSNRFVNLERLGYWLADVPLKDVYDPAVRRESPLQPDND